VEQVLLGSAGLLVNTTPLEAGWVGRLVVELANLADLPLRVYVNEGIGQVVWSPMAQGALTGKYQPGQGVPAGSRATDASGAGFIRDYLTDEILTRVAGLRPVAEEAGLSMAQLAIAWVLQNPGVSAAIIGATRPEQVRENVKASGVQLDAEIMRKIDDVLGPVVERDPARTVSPPARP